MSSHAEVNENIEYPSVDSEGCYGARPKQINNNDPDLGDGKSRKWIYYQLDVALDFHVL